MNRLGFLQVGLVAGVLFMLCVESYGQAGKYLPGVIYTKVSQDTSLALTGPDRPAFIQTFTDNYPVDSLYKPFSTDDSAIQKIYRCRLADASQTSAALDFLQQQTTLEYAERMPAYTVSAIPDDLQNGQWSLEKIDAVNAWDSTNGNAGVTIAVVDNAVSISHEDIGPDKWNNSDETAGNGIDDDGNTYVDDKHGYDVADDDPDPNPPGGISNSSPFTHGTHVAGIAAAATDNGKGIASIGYNTSIIGVKCTADTSEGDMLEYAYEGVDYAISAEADIINMSFGSSGDTYTEKILFEEANTRGITLIAAAGNNDSNDKFYPAYYDMVLAVGATNSNDEKASFSNYGSWVDVMAPGTGIYSCLVEGDNTYGTKSGTSMATPLTSGLAGLVLDKYPDLSPSDVRQRIKDGAVNIDGKNPGYEGQLGAGRIDAYRTIKENISAAESALAGNAIKVYPNPVDSRLTVETGAGQACRTIRIECSTIKGRKIRTFQAEAVKTGGHARATFDVSSLSSGTYLLKIEAGEEFISRKLYVRP